MRLNDVPPGYERNWVGGIMWGLASLFATISAFSFPLLWVPAILCGLFSVLCFENPDPTHGAW